MLKFKCFQRATVAALMIWVAGTTSGFAQEALEDSHEPHAHESTHSDKPASSEHGHAADANAADSGVDGHDHATDHGSPEEGFSVVRFVGKFHPMLVHFPIALLLAAALSEALSVVKSHKSVSEVSIYCVSLGAIGAVAAAILGWASAFGGNFEAQLGSIALVDAHRWTGTITALVSVLTMFLGAKAKRSRSGRDIRTFRVGLAVSGILVSIAGHLGASLVFGLGYFTS